MAERYEVVIDFSKLGVGEQVTMKNLGLKNNVANPGLDDVEVWDLVNTSGGWFHPIHIHLVDFRILSRNGPPPFAYEQGPKDVAYVGETETVRVVARFGPQVGRYMIHCHNLVHETTT